METTIATIDFDPFNHGSPDEKKAVGTAIAEAFRRQGFLKLVNHGIPRHTIEELFQWSQRFFALPEGIKAKAPHPPKPIPNRGYSGVGMENTSIHGSQEDRKVTLIDLKECFDQGAEDDNLYANIWLPEDDLPGFRSFMEEYYRIAYRCQQRILTALELGLGMAPKTLTSRHSRAENELRLTHYPLVPVKQLRGGSCTRISKHTDFGTITLLFQDAVGGLEIEDPLQPGRYRPIESTALDEMIVNLGDCLQRWSDGQLRSTRHRVHIAQSDLDADPNAVLAERFSVAYFAKPNRSCSIQSLAAECPPGEQTVGEFLLQRSSTTYGYTQL
ncbi:isopenicillin N synthase [Penicillium cinerascens]|uniref:Isopenicillin N synthase n=1 Tax=Penicillium cinerascens TaxID=70096 RepID=A0A9W9J5Z5_9EURO|nr:isopenicillin N synthase [Penicillium cinerascens]KAJ5190384.1 isopenicillin N synthase [Penicillium cinerascens]